MRVMSDLQELERSLDRFQLASASGPAAAVWWPQVTPLFLDGAAGWEQYTDLDGIYRELMAGHFRLWLALDGEGVVLAMLTTEEEYPKCKVLRFVWIGGSELERALPMLELIEMWAMRRGVRIGEVLGRQAWVRLLQPYGYMPKSVLLVKDLSRVKEH